MKNIWLFKEELTNSNNYLYGDGYNAEHMLVILRKNGIPIKGVIRAYTREINIFNGIPVVELEDMVEIEANILITQNKWMDIYDRISEIVSSDRIYSLGNWSKGHECIVCKSESTIKAGGDFVPFLRERMFNGKNIQTAVIHCSNCRIYYSEYRPTDQEMALLYDGYRNEDYQKLRQKYEPNYTVEFNESLFDPRDVDGRKEGIFNYISKYACGIDEWKTILDFGGDKGQFIPDQWRKKRRIVYEISNPDVVDGVELISDYSHLQDCQPDLIMCNQVMEHVSDVREYFHKLICLLKVGAYLYIEVPNERWCVDQEFVHFHEHISFFSEKTFCVLAKQFGVDLINVCGHDGTILRALFCRKR